MQKSKHYLPFVVIMCISSLIGCSKKSMKQTSGSMEPTIKRGEVVSVDLSAYTNVSPDRWDVIVFKSPIPDTGNWLGRIVGLPGETIEIRDGGVIIDGREAKLPSHVRISPYEIPKKEVASAAPGPISFPYTIPAGRYFILGDNVSNSLDSRYWGGLDRSKILGKVSGK